jgi:hypothetical protein
MGWPVTRAAKEATRILQARHARIVAFLFACCARQATLARLALAVAPPIATAIASTTWAALVIAQLPIPTWFASFCADALLVALIARAFKAVFGATNARGRTVVKKAWESNFAAPVGQACIAIATAHAVFWALLVALAATVPFFDTLLTLTICHETHCVDAAVGTWLLTLVAPRLVYTIVFASWAFAALVAIARSLIAAWDLRFLACLMAFFITLRPPKVAITLLKARSSRQVLCFLCIFRGICDNKVVHHRAVFASTRAFDITRFSVVALFACEAPSSTRAVSFGSADAIVAINVGAFLFTMEAPISAFTCLALLTLVEFFWCAFWHF